MSIFDRLFGQPQQSQQPTIVIQQPEPAPETPKEPEFNAADLFTPAETDAKPEQFDPNTLVDLDPEKIQEVMGKVNFFEGLDPQLMEQIRGGGDQALVAMMQATNSAMQKMLTTSLTASKNITTSALSKATPHIDSRVQSHLRNREVQETIASVNPIFRSPEGSFMMQALSESFSKKHPNASMDQIRDLTQRFVADFGSKLIPKPTQEETRKQSGETDWSSFLDSSPNSKLFEG